MLHILSSIDKHMHHSSATMCSTRRQLPAPALAAAIPKHPRLSRPRSAGLSARRRRSVSAPTARLVPGCAGRSRPPTRLGETKTTRKAHAQKENLPLCPAAAKRKRLAKHGPKKKISPSARRRRTENDMQNTRPKKKISPCARRRRNENDTQSEHLVLAKRTFFPCLFFAFRRGETHFSSKTRFRLDETQVLAIGGRFAWKNCHF